MKCPSCKAENIDTNKFCGQCGLELAKSTEPITSTIKGERKQATVLFSDLSSYTTLSERLDPEKVQEIMGKIFQETNDIIAKYEGRIEKYIGDAVMVLFGVPKIHEDDPVRAIKAAKEIHGIAEKMSSQVEGVIGLPLSMHTGINTGLIVTYEDDAEKGTYKVLGDTVNVASRLCSLAKAGEILVGEDTYSQTVTTDLFPSWSCLTASLS